MTDHKNLATATPDDRQRRAKFFVEASPSADKASPKWPNIIRGWGGLVGFLVFLGILGFTVYCRSSGNYPIADAVVIGLWAVVPPAWFWVEYFVVAPYQQELPDVERFKYGQDLSAKFWIAAGLLLAAIYGLSPSH
jgi:hypothetical protein